ncbi:MAG TPA: hypothetical protein VF139_05560 [Candidatus Polarisedimenticolaceae bacterium]
MGTTLAAVLLALAAGPEAAPVPPALRVESPVDGAVLTTRQPQLRICAYGGDDRTRASFVATLDGETITARFEWSGDCAHWTPSDGWLGLDERHAWSDPPYEEEGWTAGMRDGSHDLEVSVTFASGERIVERSRFRVETRRRAASLAIGFPKVSLDGFEGPFAPTRQVEARFGALRVSTLAKDAGVLKYRDKALSIGGISTRLGDEGDPGETETSLWRFALGRRRGYGYRTGDAGFLAPYHGTSMFLADADAYDGPFDPADVLAFAPFDGGVRVGTGFEGGIALGLSRSITLDAGYEQSAVYPHYVFWEALGSGLVHGVALHVADGISRQVARTAPRAAPIVSFLLRNGISYVIHHQRRSEVNWPFGGGAGLIDEGFKVSFTFTY